MDSKPQRAPSSGPAPRTYRDFELHPFQAEAIEAIERNENVLVSAPTGAGKTLIAEAAIERGLERGDRVVYTSPIKALSNQKYRDFGEHYGDAVGLMTGDLTLNAEARVLIMTTEIFRNTLFEDPERMADVSYVIFDEVHYLGDLDRGTVWEESIVFAPKPVRFLGLSATIPNLEEIALWMESIREGPVTRVGTDKRPVPLLHETWVPQIGLTRVGKVDQALAKLAELHPKRGRGGRDGRDGRDGDGRRGRRGPPPRHASGGPDPVDHIIEAKLLPALFFCFSRREVENRAHRYARAELLSAAESRAILADFDELASRYGVEELNAVESLRPLAGRGILFHHAGMLPSAKEIVERLFTKGLVKLLFTTETFALGINAPAKAVLFSGLRKYDGIGFRYLGTLDYYQMAGRAGRQGLDREGRVIALIDPDNDDQKAVKRVVFGDVAPVNSRFNLSYSAVLALHRDLGDEIQSAVDRSFAAFQRGQDAEPERAMLRSRLRVLERQGYLTPSGLTGKGRIAVRIHGYEIQVAELCWAGLFEGLEPRDLIALFVSITYEARRGQPNERPGPKLLGGRAREALKTVEAFRRNERKFGLEVRIKAPEFGLTHAVHAWSDGASFAELERISPVQGGDLVRTLRMSVQMVRQFAAASEGDVELVGRLQEAIDSVYRDEVDAERQLEL